jgi:hypothetical protein
MKHRRSLADALKPDIEIPRAEEEKFVYGDKATDAPPSQPPLVAQPAEAKEGKGQKGNVVARVPLTTRVRSDFAEALKRASLERQLNKVFPNTLQDILEEALQPWLRSNGYLN